jgi:hypothetical protein
MTTMANPWSTVAKDPGKKTAYEGAYFSFNDRAAVNHARNNITNAKDTTMNLMMIQGVVPGQNNQGNGGLINFPRMLEDWYPSKEYTLSLDGSFIQLKFSNYATGPFDHDAFEPGTTPTTKELIFHYFRPKRDYGYDVGLLYHPSGAVAGRMSDINIERDEFYREPAADDEYICKLRQAIGFNCN